MLDADNIFLVMEMRRMGISDIRIMEAVEKVSLGGFPEEGFVNEIYQSSNKSNKPINRFLAVAMICEALQVERRHKVLEISTGSGYQTAILSKLCRRVYSIDLNKDIIQNAEKRISGAGISNFTLMKADIEKGLENQAPFDRIIVNHVFYEVPEIIKKQLAEGGIMIAPVGFPESENQQLKSFCLNEGVWQEKEIVPIKFVFP